MNGCCTGADWTENKISKKNNWNLKKKNGSRPSCFGKQDGLEFQKKNDLRHEQSKVPASGDLLDLVGVRTWYKLVPRCIDASWYKLVPGKISTSKLVPGTN
jgi:hypothetical protein